MAEIEQIRSENLHRIGEAAEMVAIVERDGVYEVHHHTRDGVCPQSFYPTKREAVARVMQLMKVGPVAPQTWPEQACIGPIDAQGETDAD